MHTNINRRERFERIMKDFHPKNETFTSSEVMNYINEKLTYSHKGMSKFEVAGIMRSSPSVIPMGHTRVPRASGGLQRLDCMLSWFGEDSDMIDFYKTISRRIKGMDKESIDMNFSWYVFLVRDMYIWDVVDSPGK